MKWIKYKIPCDTNNNVLIDKKLQYTNANLVIAKNESYNGSYLIEDDGRNINDNPLPVDVGGTGACNPDDACKNLGALAYPKNPAISEGLVYMNEDGSTRLVSQKLFKYSVIVDNGVDGSPDAVEYADDCAGFIPMSMEDGVLNEGSWKFNPLLDMFRPCAIKPGASKPEYYLDKNNLSKKEDGTNAILNGSDDTDIMVEVFGVLYGKFEKTNDGRVKISVMNYEEPDCFCYNDFGSSSSPTIKNRFYRGRYKAYAPYVNYSYKMRSVSGVTPSVNISRGSFRSYAVSRGSGYHQNNLYMLFLWQAMFLLLFKNRNSQQVLGKSNCGSGSISMTGWSDNKGWIWGDQSGKNGVVFLGVEDFYGNIWEWVDGMISYYGSTFYVTRRPNNYGSNYYNLDYAFASALTNDNSNKYLTSIVGTNLGGFLPANSGGSTNTFYCDNLWIDTRYQKCPRFGGSYHLYAVNGAFCWNLTSGDSTTSDIVGSRLCRA